MNPGIREYRVNLDPLGIETRVLEAGSGPVAVLLHGNPDNADEWRPLLALLGKKYRCIAPDLPGYGKSPEPPPLFTYSVRGQIEFLDAFLRTVGVSEKFILVVHDIGGIMGIPWAAANSNRLLGMMITNTVVFDDFRWFGIARRWGGTSPIGRVIARLSMNALTWRGGAIFKKVFWGQSPQLPEAEVDRITATFALNQDARNTSIRQFREYVRPGYFAGYDKMRAQVIASIPCRVLWGDGDPYVPTRYAHTFAPAAITVLPEVGHWVPIVAASQLAEEIDRLQQDVENRQRAA